MKKTKIISLIMVLATIFSIALPVYAVEDGIMLIDDDYSTMPITTVDDASTDSIKVLLNGEKIDFTDENGNKVDPQLINSRTMVPVRKIFEVLGATIAWDGETETVTATAENKVIKLQINNNIATVLEGEITETLELDSAPVVIDGRTLVPVRFISETLGLKVGWDQETQTVIIFDTQILIDIVKEEAPTFYAMLLEETTEVKTGEADFTLDANVKYTNADDKSKNTNIKIKLTGLIKIAEKAVGMDFDYKVTGKGTLFDEMKAEGMDKLDLKAIVDEKTSAVYMKSSMLESEIGDKWAKQPIENSDQLFAPELLEKVYIPESQEERLKLIVDTLFDNINITLNTLDQARVYTLLACKFLSDDYMSVTGRTAKTYKYELTLADLQNMLNNLNVEVKLSDVFKTAKLTFTSKYENGVNTEATLGLSLNLKSGAETIVIDLNLKSIMSKINEKVVISIPAEKDTITVDEIE